MLILLDFRKKLRRLVFFQFYYISMFVCFSNSKGSSNSEPFEDEENSDVSIITSSVSDNENHDSEEEISDILLDSDKQVTLSILIFDSRSCIASS